MKKYFTNRNYLASFVALLFIMLFAPLVNAATVATGGVGGFYHNGLFNIFKDAVDRASRGGMSLEYANENGTDGTLANLEMVNNGEADIAFVQLDGIALQSFPNVQIIGVFGYEVPHLVVPKKSNIESCDTLESKTNFRIGRNSFSGSAVTTAVMVKVDKDYDKANFVDTLDEVEAEMGMTDGSIDGFFFVSTPGSGSVTAFNSAQFKFLDCWDGDFDDFDVNNRQLYEKVKMKKDMGYPNNFVTFSIPGVVVANKSFLKADRNNTRTLLAATKATMQTVKAAKKFKFYPED